MSRKHFGKASFDDQEWDIVKRAAKVSGQLLGGYLRTSALMNSHRILSLDTGGGADRDGGLGFGIDEGARDE